MSRQGALQEVTNLRETPDVSTTDEEDTIFRPQSSKPIATFSRKKRLLGQVRGPFYAFFPLAVPQLLVSQSAEAAGAP